jgi:glucose/mannose-6-phosphate isomerase
MSELFDDVLTLPAQLRWGVDLDPAGVSADRGIVLLGMGGSAMAATVGSLAATSASPIEVYRSYGLPGWAAASAASVIAVSYSGNTEEVLSGVDAAIAAGLEISIVTSGGRLEKIAAERGLPMVLVPGGMQPRAGVGYQAAAVTRVLGASGVIADAPGELTEAADVVDGLLGQGAGAAVRQGTDIASKLAGKTAVIYGGFGVGATAAYRWKTQINENAKVPAYAGVIPEMNHNELEGWHDDSGEHFAIVYLRDQYDHPRIDRRLLLSESVIGDAATYAGSVSSSGTGAIARWSSMSVVGDVASLVVAELAGTNPTPVPTIEGFKESLGKEDE